MSGNNQYNVSEITTYTFPYLDLIFFWNDKEKSEIPVHIKANQNSKYLNKSITHMNATFKAILGRIFN